MSASRQIAINFDVIFQLAFSPYYKYNQEFSVFFWTEKTITLQPCLVGNITAITQPTYKTKIK